ncbi:MAG: cyclic nucleotide-binding domain-containing protein [Desulfobacterales bacterium]|uniref:Cyclic nucleotide-binding domain-containing protein n=1 Tax=Candidatus Desulfatibia vada TaxID=2841696 RepID=A0A8J6NUN7_9BACT|nr:cyclic nucleotide-binding domain-containing protein [Candidatus Desulfatibia vada]MBL6970681.1 cyclic nucleotide-binding domain-containing protein [Desulfobacterales bacterium]
MKDIENLAKTSLFALMKDRDLKRIAKLANHIFFKKGELIIKEGENDGRLFVIISGEVEIIKSLGDPNQKHLRFLGPNHYFGEMALIDDYVRTASVVAMENTEVLSLDQWNIRKEIAKNPSVAIELLQALSRRIREAEEHLC